MGRQAQLRGDVRAQQDLMHSNEAAVGRLQAEASVSHLSLGHVLHVY